MIKGTPTNIKSLADQILSGLVDQPDKYMQGFTHAQDGINEPPYGLSDKQLLDWKAGHEAGVFIQQFIDGDFDDQE